MRMVFAVVLAIAAQAQPQPAGRVEFEVVSVKPGDPSVPGSGVTTFPGRLVMRRTTLKNLLISAFRVSDYQIAAGPKWMESANFDIDAKLPAGAPLNQAPAMMQTMLADRFKLKAGQEARPTAIPARRTIPLW